ncbi:MAG TPA: hypothetical protein VG842_02105 [Sediminibacterium sp.]|nr:hypothetical protein [Sediminibacterium sp.]
MKKISFFLCLSALLSTAFLQEEMGMQISKSHTIDSLGACQGASYQQGDLFLYGDREVGMIRRYRMAGDSLLYMGNEMKLTVGGKDVINHPTGLAVHGNLPVFIGNSIRLNPEGTLWKAMIYQVNWKGLQQTGTLDHNLLHTIEDDTCVQGTRPEYVSYHGKWYVATADYGGKNNEVRLYDPARLTVANKTSEEKVLVKKFTCGPWVQNLQWIPEKKWLLLIQNQVEGRKWRFTYVDLEQSIASGTARVMKVIDINERNDELEGYTFLENLQKGIAVTSSRRNNVNTIRINW